MMYLLIAVWALIVGLHIGETLTKRRFQKQLFAHDSIKAAAERVLVAEAFVGPDAYMTVTTDWELGGRKFSVVVQPK